MGWYFNKYMKKLVLAVVWLTITMLSAQSLALTKGFQAISLIPATDGGPYISIWGSKNLKQLQWEAGTLAVYAYRPLQLTQNGNRTRGILDNTIVQHFYGQLGVFDRWLSVGLDLPMGWWVQYRDPNVASATNQNKTAVGDIIINFKSEFFRSKHFGLALRPFITLPTGYGGEFFGNGTVSGGGDLIFEMIPHEYASFSLNLGVDARDKFVFRNMEKSQQFNMGFGTSIKITDPVSIVAEVAATTRLTSPFENKVESPAEFRGAVKWKVGKTGLLATAGGTAGIMRGSGVPTYSVFAGISFSPRRRERKIRKPKIDFAEYAVYFANNSYSLDDAKGTEKICDLSDEIRNKDIKVKVVGYSDSIGSEAYNKKLSKKRAEKVSWFLQMLGVDPLDIFVDGVGEADPIATNKTSEGRAENRRVEFNK